MSAEWWWSSLEIRVTQNISLLWFYRFFSTIFLENFLKRIRQKIILGQNNTHVNYCLIVGMISHSASKNTKNWGLFSKKGNHKTTQKHIFCCNILNFLCPLCMSWYENLIVAYIAGKQRPRSKNCSLGFWIEKEKSLLYILPMYVYFLKSFYCTKYANKWDVLWHNV